MDLRGKRILVTGAMGFIGSHLVERLTTFGAEVVAFGRYNSRGSLGWLEASPFRNDFQTVLGDIRDAALIRKTCVGVDCVFHLAALIGIPFSYTAPESYVQTNIVGTLNLLEAARANEIERFIHTSTSEVYGTARAVPISEEHRLQAQSPYAASKIAADKLVESYFLSFGLPVLIARPFNTFGPRQSFRAVIPTIIQQAQRGPEIRLGNLESTRDFNFVANTIDGFLALTQESAVLGRTYNFGSGQEIRIADLVVRILEILDLKRPVVSEQNRMRPATSEIDRLQADSSLAANDLGWSPRVNLTEGLSRTVEWMAQQKGEFDNSYVL